MNMNLLRAKIVERGFTQHQVAKAIGISANGLSRRLLGKCDFTLSEVRNLCRVLRIKDPARIFGLGIEEEGDG